MDPIYVCGHRNPDTDSVVSAMAFAALHNALGDNAYVAAMQGAPNDETQFLLDRFGFQAPTLLTNVRTQVRDIDYDRPPTLGTSVPISHAWAVLREDENLSAVPVTNEDGTLYGMLTAGGTGRGNVIADPFHLHFRPGEARVVAPHLHFDGHWFTSSYFC